MNLLAQINVAPLELGGWMLSAGAVLWIYNQARVAFGGAPKRELVRGSQSSEECDKKHKELDQNRRDFRAEHNKTHDALDKINEDQWSEIGRHTQEIHALTSAIGEIPQRTVKLIKEAREL